MIVDTSAVVALVQGERPHATLVAAALAGAHSPVMSAPTVAECLIVLTARHGPVARTIFERLRSEIGLSVSSFTAEHAAATQRAFLRYGKGRHRAALNFGDCMMYATAQLATNHCWPSATTSRKPTLSSAASSATGQASRNRMRGDRCL